MKTTSILESIRNKINKIEKSNTQGEPQEEVHDDFEYIDDNSKNIVNSKQGAMIRTTDSSGANTEVAAQATDEDFDFLSDGNEEENNPTKAVETAPVQKAAPAQVNRAPIAPAPQNKDDDLDLDNIDIEDLEEKSKASTSPLKKDDDLDLDNLNVDDLEETNTPVAAPVSMSAPVTPARTAIEEKLQAMQQPSAPITNDPNDLDFAAEEESAPESPINNPIGYGQPEPIQNNYQTQSQNIMNNSNNSSQIISEDIARKTQDAVRDIINSVPKPQNQQVLSTSAPAFKSGETIEDMVAAILAPKLEQWINENLPPMVEKIVKNEIKRLFPKDDH